MVEVETEHYEQPELWGEDRLLMPEAIELRIAATLALLPRDTSTVADVGAGDGRVLHRLVGERPGITLAVAIDRSRAALGHVRVPAAQATTAALALADRGVDAVMCCEVLEHLPPPVYLATRAELARVAARTIVISVPNRENLRRADVRCLECGCVFQRERHLRSFTPDDLPDLLDDFVLDEVVEVGPRQPVYPRQLRLLLERRGILRPSGSPSCPQCGTPYTGRPSDFGAPDSARSAEGSPGGQANARYRAIRALSPKARHPYWLCARFTRP